MSDEYHIQGFADTGYRIGSAVFCLLLFAIGGALFRFLDHHKLDLFWTLWFGFTGGVAFLTLISRNAVVTRATLRFNYSFLGILPVFHRTVMPRSDFLSIERRCLKAIDYDEDAKGIYRHQIALISKRGKDCVLQEFHVRPDQHPPIVLNAATEIANRLALPLSHRVETW